MGSRRRADTEVIMAKARTRERSGLLAPSLESLFAIVLETTKTRTYWRMKGMIEVWMYRFFEWVRVYIVAALLVGGNKSLLGELPLTGLINSIIILILTVQLWIEINFEISLTDERFHQKFERDQSHSFCLHRNQGAHLHHLVRSSYSSFLVICY